MNIVKLKVNTVTVMLYFVYHAFLSFLLFSFVVVIIIASCMVYINVFCTVNNTNMNH